MYPSMKLDLRHKRVLHLTLKKLPFEAMVTGEKNVEYRDRSRWMNSRLFWRDNSRRHYDYVFFRNGYGLNRPWFVAEYLGFSTVEHIDITYSNGLTVKFDEPKYGIQIGKVLESGNFDSQLFLDADKRLNQSN